MTVEESPAKAPLVKKKRETKKEKEAREKLEKEKLAMAEKAKAELEKAENEKLIAKQSAEILALAARVVASEDNDADRSNPSLSHRTASPSERGHEDSPTPLAPDSSVSNVVYATAQRLRKK